MHIQMSKPVSVRFTKASVFKNIMLETICAGLSEQVQSLLVEFLQAIGEVRKSSYCMHSFTVCLDSCYR